MAQMPLLAGQVGSLWDALTSVPDHRRAECRRYPPASFLLTAVAALPSGRRDQLDIVHWGRKLGTDALAILLKTFPLKDIIITGDAIFTQKKISRTIIDGGGDDFFTVKDNQPAMKTDIGLGSWPMSPLCRVVAAA